jgi:hypothetical protein
MKYFQRLIERPDNFNSIKLKLSGVFYPLINIPRLGLEFKMLQRLTLAFKKR